MFLIVKVLIPFIFRMIWFCMQKVLLMQDNEKPKTPSEMKTPVPGCSYGSRMGLARARKDVPRSDWGFGLLVPIFNAADTADGIWGSSCLF